MSDAVERVAMPARYDGLVPAGVGVAVWLLILALEGPRVALQNVWILLLLVFPLAAWTILPRLRFSRSRLRVTLGPWSRAVDLNELESIRWKDDTYGWSSQGTILARDRSGHQVRISVGGFKRGNEWGPLLLQAAAASRAAVDAPSREILEEEAAGRRPMP